MLHELPFKSPYHILLNPTFYINGTHSNVLQGRCSALYYNASRLGSFAFKVCLYTINIYISKWHEQTLIMISILIFTTWYSKEEYNFSRWNYIYFTFICFSVTPMLLFFLVLENIRIIFYILEWYFIVTIMIRVVVDNYSDLITRMMKYSYI